MQNEITLYATDGYNAPGVHMRPMTIAAFHVAQESDKLSDKPMRKDVLMYLTSRTAVRYWSSPGQGWLEKCGKHSSGAELLRLTSRGLAVCSRDASRSAAQDIINQWRGRMLEQDSITTESKTFELPL